MSEDIYREYASALLKKVKDKVNGYVVFELYPYADTVLIRAENKDFKFSYVFKDIQDRMLSGEDDALDEFITAYKADLMRCFFKSEKKKEWERKTKKVPFWMEGR